MSLPEKIDFIKDLKVQNKQLNLLVIVLEIGQRYFTKDHHEIRTVKVADRTGSVNLCVWDEIGIYLQPGDICRLIRCYTSLYKGSLTLYTGRSGKIIKTGEFCMLFSEHPNMSETNRDSPTQHPSI